ncbi:hypothetical protein B0H10DRAFT_2085039 [Mycena sp. CBHHK59/15]|nr:hypothetical protein B0H10DRAFT_2085039 [Mycena sp. CBHHK59/15]
MYSLPSSALALLRRPSCLACANAATKGPCPPTPALPYDSVVIFWFGLVCKPWFWFGFSWFWFQNPQTKTNTMEAGLVRFGFGLNHGLRARFTTICSERHIINIT